MDKNLRQPDLHRRLQSEAERRAVIPPEQSGEVMGDQGQSEPQIPDHAPGPPVRLYEGNAEHRWGPIGLARRRRGIL